MGKEIVYCARCQTLLRAGDFENGKAVWSSEKPYCLDCIMGLLSTLPPEEEQRILATMARKRAPTPPPEETPRRGTARKTSTARIPIVKPESAAAPPSGSTGLVIGVVATMVVLGALVASMSTRATPPARTPEPRRVAVSETVPPPAPVPIPVRDMEVVRREETARRSLEKARAFGKTNPEDLPGRIALLEEAAWEARGTGLAEEARREHDQLQKERGERLAKELAPSAEKARAAAAAEKFGEALDLLRKERSRLTGPDWTSAIDQLTLQTRERADQRYAEARDKAVAARRAGAEQQVQAAVARVASWGIEDLATDLRAVLASVPPPPPALAPDVRAYRTSWENAVALARARDYAPAVQALDAAVAQVRDPAVRKEAASDLELLKLLSSAHSDILQFLARAPKGTKLSLETETSSGAAMRVEGSVVRATSESIELRPESDPVVVEYDELTAASLRDLLGKIPGRRSDVDARLGALFLLLEGEPGGAPAETIPASFREYGARVRAERRRDDLARQEADARARFESVEREYQDPATMLESFNRYRALQASHGDTAFLRRKRPLIARRLESEKEAGKEYVWFADQMRAAGSFRRSSYPKAAVCWTLDRDLPADKPKDAFVEVAYSARAETEYRCWVLAGGCCAETFAFDVQGTEIASATPVKNSLLFLKKTHAAHGGRKEPTRFEWIPVPLPKYSAAGLKTIQLLAGQQGFSVAALLVTSIRTAPPAENLLKEMERARPAPRSSVPDPVAAWSLDEGTGTAANDPGPLRLSGTLRNDPVWITGKRRGALSFDGRDDFVEIPKHPKLYFSGPFTIAAWLNVTEYPTIQWGMYAVSDYSGEGNRCTLSLRIVPAGNAQFFWQNEDVTPPVAASVSRLARGTWTHVAGVWDGTTRLIYLNGVLEGTNAAPQPRPSLGGALSIGRPGSYNGLYFRGKIDEVRLFDRALSSGEIQALFAR